MIPLRLGEFAAIVGGRLVGGDPALVVSGSVQTDSREIERGGVFFAKPGEVTDGHLFAPAAVAAGAALVVAERELELDAPQVVVADVVEALGALATAVVARVRALGALRVVGITGSNGKTTTKNLLRSILEPLGPTVAPEKSYNNEVGAPLTMLRIAEDTRFLVAEMGASHVGDIRRLVRMAPPDVGVVLMVGLAHAGEFGGIEATVEAKSEMVVDLAPDAVAVLNRDDPRVAGMAERTRARVLWFGRGPDADVRALDVEAGASGTAFTLQLPGGEAGAPERRAVRFPVLGEHHVANALAAATAAHALGVGADAIVAGLERVTRAERWRMEVLGGNGVTVVNDAYNASPDSMSAALRTLAQLAGPGSRTIAVLGEMSELGELSGPEHDRIGLQVVRLGIDQLVVVGEGARRLHISAVNEGSWNGESLYAETQDEAYELLMGLLRPGDIVLVKSSNAAGLRALGDRLGESFSW